MTHEDVAEHIRLKVAEAEIVLDPFPHMIMEAFFPDRIFDEIMKNWPPSRLFEINRSMQRWDILVHRRLDDFPKETQQFWRDLLQWATLANRLMAERIRPYFDLKFVPYLGKKWKEQVEYLELDVGGVKLA